MKNSIALLLVDDDEDDRNLFREALSEIDATIDCFIATDGLNALEVLNNCKTLPDFIFLDLNMPRRVKNTISLCKKSLCVLCN